MSQEKKQHDSDCPYKIGTRDVCSYCEVPSPIVEEKDKQHWLKSFLELKPIKERFNIQEPLYGRENNRDVRIIADFISQTLAEERERIVEIVDKHHAEELVELEASNNQTNTKNIITAGLDIYKRKLINIIKNNK